MADSSARVSRCHDVLGGLAGEVGSVQNLLMVFFSFLQQRTDFYMVDASPSRPMGFDAGVAERMVLSAFRSFPLLGPDRSPLHTSPSPSPQKASKLKGVASGAAKADAAAAAPSAPSSSLPLTGAPQPRKDAAARGPGADDDADDAATVCSSATIARLAAAARLVRLVRPPAPGGGRGASAPDGDGDSEGDEAAAAAGAAGRGPEGAPSPLPRELLQVPICNGGVGARNGHWWHQTLEDVTLFVAVPASVRSRDVAITLAAPAEEGGETNRIRVGFWLEGAAEATVALDGCLPSVAWRASKPYVAGSFTTPPRLPSAAPAESAAAAAPSLASASFSELEPVWSLEAVSSRADAPSRLWRERPLNLFDYPFADGAAAGAAAAPSSPAAAAAVLERGLRSLPVAERRLFLGPCKILSLTLKKEFANWWRSALVGSPLVDATQVDSTQSVESYDAETQAAIRRIMYDQGRKAKGLPTSEEEAAADAAATVAAAAAAAAAAPPSPRSSHV